MITPKTQAAIFSPTLEQQASPSITTNKKGGAIPPTPSSKKDCGNLINFLFCINDNLNVLVIF